MKIDSINSCDYVQVLDIYNYYILNDTCTFEVTPLSINDMSDRIDSICSKYPFLVLKEDDKVLGYAYIHEFNMREAFNITCEISIYIDHKYTNKGLASALMQDIINRAKLMEIKNIIAVITSENINSINFHKRYGFKSVGHLEDVGYKFNRLLGIDYLQLKL